MGKYILPMLISAIVLAAVFSLGAAYAISQQPIQGACMKVTYDLT